MRSTGRSSPPQTEPPSITSANRWLWTGTPRWWGHPWTTPRAGLMQGRPTCSSVPGRPGPSRPTSPAPDGAAFDSFGVSVAVDGDTAVVGAYLDDTPGGSDAGSAYVFVRSGTTWTEQAHLSAPDAEFNDNFGLPVAVDGDTAVVGAESGDSPTVADSGAAYVFVRLGTTWTAQDKLTAPDAERSDLFSSSLAVSGDTAVVGASHDATPAGFEAGSAYVFVRSGSAWTPQAHLTAPDAEVGDDFGRAV